MGPTDRQSEFRGLGRPVGEGSTEAQRWLTALGRVSPACRWRSSVVGALARRNRVACSGIVHGVGVPPYWPSAPANQRTEGGNLAERTHEASDRAQYPSDDDGSYRLGQIKRVWDARQGGSAQNPREIETHGIEWMSVACGRQA